MSSFLKFNFREEEGIEMQVLNSKRVSVTPDCSPPPSSTGDSNDLATQQNSSTIGIIKYCLYY
jgi:hypothetical protein